VAKENPVSPTKTKKLKKVNHFNKCQTEILKARRHRRVNEQKFNDITKEGVKIHLS
jgi:hypothetical protein